MLDQYKPHLKSLDSIWQNMHTSAYLGKLVIIMFLQKMKLIKYEQEYL
jgi:hypothetical protein